MAAEYRARETQSLERRRARRTATGATKARGWRRASPTFVGCDADEMLFTRGAGEAISIVAPVSILPPATKSSPPPTSIRRPEPVAGAGAPARHRGEADRTAGADDRAGAGARAVRRRSHRAHAACSPSRHVQYADGAVMPVRELCQFARQRNIVSVVDGAQALGMLDFTLRDLGCDFYAARVSQVAGRQPRHRHAVRAPRDARSAVADRSRAASTLRRRSSRPTESAGHSGVPAALHKFGNIVPLRVAGVARREAALDFQQQVAAHSHRGAHSRAGDLCATCVCSSCQASKCSRPVAPGLWAGILTFRMPGRSAADVALRRWRDQSRVTSAICSGRAHERTRMRVSLHMFNSHDEIEQLMQGLQQALRCQTNEARHRMERSYLLLTGSLSGLRQRAGAFGRLVDRWNWFARACAQPAPSSRQLQFPTPCCTCCCGTGLGLLFWLSWGLAAHRRRALVGARAVVRQPVLAGARRCPRSSALARARRSATGAALTDRQPLGDDVPDRGLGLCVELASRSA